MNSRYSNTDHQRAALKKLLYSMLDELEDKPKDIGFPFNLLVNLVQFLLIRLENWISSGAIAFEAWIKPKAGPIQTWFRRRAASPPGERR
jgi:hypothetical protein